MLSINGTTDTPQRKIDAIKGGHLQEYDAIEREYNTQKLVVVNCRKVLGGGRGATKFLQERGRHNHKSLKRVCMTKIITEKSVTTKILWGVKRPNGGFGERHDDIRIWDMGYGAKVW
ncbi:hypothetical protein VNO78_01194 [Psophocarpus tetragonolobus]|uniref:Uncharacterized protein n=1 Tax=Psophocarpus tetragonolobus TaxID=3891 RepID=A0AAN9SXR3_PSOTE